MWSGLSWNTSGTLCQTPSTCPTDGSHRRDADRHLLDDGPEAVRAFQIYQHADASISLRYVVGSDPRADQIVAHVRDIVRSMVHDKVPATTEPVEAIPHEGGKTRYIVSDRSVRV